MRKEVIGSIFILVIMVASLFTFLIPGGDNGIEDDLRDLQLKMDNTDFFDVISLLPTGVETIMYTNFGNETGDELAIWAAANTGAPSETMLGRSPDWFINVNYPYTQGSSSFEQIEHWITMMSFGNFIIYDYPNDLTPYRGINITRHPNFFYTPNTEPVLVTAEQNDIAYVLDIWMQDNSSETETAFEELAVLLKYVPEGVNWAILNDYSNSTSPLNFAAKVFTSITTLDDGDYYLNVSSHVKYDGQPNASLFTIPANANSNVTFYIESEYVYYGIRGDIEVILDEIIRLAVFG